ncbi:hypothetical protein D9M73_56840 [compost metagenome]
MHLTLNHPEVLPHLKGWGGGLWAAKVESKWCLLIKVSKEMILTAKVNEGFDFYLAPIAVDGVQSYCLMTVFFDDDDEPLVIRTPLIKDDECTENLFQLLASDEIEVFFFDEHDRELLSWSVTGDLGGMREKLMGVQYFPMEQHREMLGQAGMWFGLRSSGDDDAAYPMRLVNDLFPGDFFILDARPDMHAFHGAKKFSFTSLEREEPGAYQELDIVLLLRRVFPELGIYLNPIKEVDGLEFVDILVVGEFNAYLIQAKDSPNTQKILQNTVQRKRTRSIAQVKEAAKQLQGAISFFKENPKLRFKKDGEPYLVDLTGKSVVGIIVIKEIFNDTMKEYSRIVFDLMSKTKKNVVVFDYPELSMMTLHCPTEGLFLGAVMQILDAAYEHGELPRLRYSGKPRVR